MNKVKSFFESETFILHVFMYQCIAEVSLNIFCSLEKSLRKCESETE